MRVALPYLSIIFVAIVGGCTGVIYPELQRAKNSQKPIFVGNITAGKPNKNGYTNVLAQFFNTSAKTYKYVNITIEAYNRVGDTIQREGDGSPLVELRFTGPLAPRRTPGVATWPKVWRSGPINCLDIKRIDISHIDGTTIAITGPALLDVISRKLKRKCHLA